MSEKVAYIPLTDLNRGKASKIITDLKKKKQSVFIIKNNKPEAVMISMEEYNDYREYLFYREVSKRIEAYKADPVTFSREDIMKEYNISEEEIDLVSEPELDYE